MSAAEPPVQCFLNLTEKPLKCLPESIGQEWHIWEEAAKEIPALLSTGRLRHIVDNELPELHFRSITGFPEIVMERAYTIISFMAHAYIRGAPGDQMIKKLPRKVAQVWVDVARALDLPPISTYASTVLFNLHFNGQPECLDDLSVVFTSTGLDDEKWFYLVSAGIELEGTRVIGIAEELMSGHDGKIDFCLSELDGVIVNLTSILKRMYERCNPFLFYHEIRRFFAGWLNDCELDGNGLVYELESGDAYFNIAGGSAAQSPTIQLIDILLNIAHSQTANEETLLAGQMKNNNYLKEMRSYMPLAHRKYLERCEVFFSQTQVFERIRASPNYAGCVRSLAEFRSAHIIMVTRYIVNPAIKSQGSTLGTGGSNPIPLLKQLRDETLKNIQ